MENVLNKSKEAAATFEGKEFEQVGRYISESEKTDQHALIQHVLKRAIDIIGSLVFFLIFGWLYIAVWITVMITTGRPAIYKHARVGKAGKEFNCLKFRSMVLNSAEVLQRYLAENPAARTEWEKDFKLKDDPRITRFGKILRKTSLDELPQFWNVLKGEMSLVGPRPVVRKELQKYYGKRSIAYASVRPGITGPWQVGGRSDLDYDQRVFLDAEYARNWTVRGDIKILIKTVSAVLSRRGSY